MKKLFMYGSAAILVSLLFFNCNDGANGDDFAETNYAPRGALISTSNLVNGFFDLADADNSFISFDMDAKGDAVTNTEISINYKDSGEVPLMSVSSLPTEVNVNMNDILSALNLTAADISIGDVVTFSFDAVTSGSKYRSSNSLNVPFSCKSSLAGTYDYVSTNLQASNGYPCPAGEVTGTVTFTSLGGGVYQVSDLGFGQYESSCWNDGPATSNNARIKDVCNKITSGGLDQYNLVYIWTITDVSGPNLSISWANDYGDSGDVVLRRGDGTDWPALFSE